MMISSCQFLDLDKIPPTSPFIDNLCQVKVRSSLGASVCLSPSIRPAFRPFAIFLTAGLLVFFLFLHMELRDVKRAKFTELVFIVKF